MIINKDTNINTVIQEDITITNYSTFHFNGIVNGNIYVEDGSVLFLDGILNGNLITNPNTSSYIKGTMNGSILSNTGKIELSGMLHTRTSVPANVIKIAGCYINNRKY